MERYWVVTQDIKSDGIYSAEYNVTKINKQEITKKSYVKLEKGIYYTSFDKVTWIRMHSKPIKK